MMSAERLDDQPQAARRNVQSSETEQRRLAAASSCSAAVPTGDSLLANCFPVTGALAKSLFINRPVVQDGRFKVGAVRPGERMNFRIDLDLFKQGKVPQWAVQLAGQDRSEVDRPRRAVCEPDRERVRSDNFESCDAMDCVVHSSILTARSARGNAACGAARRLPRTFE